MELDIREFVRRPFPVKAVQVTAENIEAVAKWCDGEIFTSYHTVQDKTEHTSYIKVRVVRPMNERQTKAYIGDWVLYSSTGFKCFMPKAMTKDFEEVVVEEVLAMVEPAESPKPPDVMAVVIEEVRAFATNLIRLTEAS